MRKILFVDDEPRLLDGLSRMLRPHRDRWEMTFALGGDEAIAELTREQFDIVICDMRMPIVDGLVVLRYAREHSPRTVRIALSGQTDFAIMTHALPIVHQFLSKPCSPSTLVAVIERVCGLQGVLEHPTLQAIVGQMGELPSLPRTYERFVEAIENPETTIRELVGIVEQDVALSARCLQLANSAYFGLRRRLDTLGQAVTYLGVSTLRAMVLSSAIFSAFRADGRLTHTELEQLERHAVLVANTAKLLLVDEDARQQAFMAGMLHDIGRLILSTLDTDPLDTLAEIYPLEAGLEAEQTPAEITHAEVGAYLLGLWGLPHPIVEAVAFHHHPERVHSEQIDVLGAVFLANELVNERCGTGERSANTTPCRLIPYLEGIDSVNRLAELRAIAADVVAASGGHDE
jgi:HD-like signal output (HDOD) protein/ActR/RegA family two-component response regulator